MCAGGGQAWVCAHCLLIQFGGLMRQVRETVTVSRLACVPCHCGLDGLRGISLFFNPGKQHSQQFSRRTFDALTVLLAAINHAKTKMAHQPASAEILENNFGPCETVSRVQIQAENQTACAPNCSRSAQT